MQKDYEEYFISSGDNFPQISLFKEDRYKLLVGLHHGFSVDQVREFLKWNDTVLQFQIQLLKDNGYLKSINNKWIPAISIMTIKEGNEHLIEAEKFSYEITRSLMEIEPTIESLYNQTEVSKNYAYKLFKFFLYSNVLMDNWQIDNVEKEFLKKERPLRHGKRYYIQLAEKSQESQIEFFGIYGNQYSCKDSICFNIYGNNRIYGLKPIEELLIDQNIPYLSLKDQKIFEKMALIYAPKLMDILEKNREAFKKYYLQTRYRNEVSFEDFFIWFYHFLYTQVTDELAKKEFLTIPSEGNFIVKVDAD